MFHIANRTYEVVVDHKNGWKPEAFRDRYSEVLDRYDYIVGDWGYNQLRLRGFFKETHPKVSRDTTIATLQDYLNEYCNFGCAYFIIERIPSKDGDATVESLDEPEEEEYEPVTVPAAPKPQSQQGDRPQHQQGQRSGGGGGKPHHHGQRHHRDGQRHQGKQEQQGQQEGGRQEHQGRQERRHEHRNKHEQGQGKQEQQGQGGGGGGGGQRHQGQRQGGHQGQRPHARNHSKPRDRDRNAQQQPQAQAQPREEQGER